MSVMGLHHSCAASSTQSSVAVHANSGNNPALSTSHRRPASENLPQTRRDQVKHRIGAIAVPSHQYLMGTAQETAARSVANPICGKQVES